MSGLCGAKSSRATRSALACITCVSLATNLACATVRPLPRDGQPVEVRLRNPQTIIVRHAAGETRHADVAAIQGWISEATEIGLEMDVHRLIGRDDPVVSSDAVGTTFVDRRSVERITELGHDWRSHRPGPVFLAAAAVTLVAGVFLMLHAFKVLTLFR